MRIIHEQDMNKVFAKRKRQNSKSGKKNGSSQKGSGDGKDEYFPRNGGNGAETFPVYDPVEVMNESEVNIPEDDSLRRDIQRALRRVALRDNDSTAETDGISIETYADNVDAFLDKRQDSTSYLEQNPEIKIKMPAGTELPLNSASQVSGTGAIVPKSRMKTNAARIYSSEPDLSTQPQDFGLNAPAFNQAEIISFIRAIALKTVVLKPLDSVADRWPQFVIAVAGVEVFVLMIVADIAAQIVRLVCKPAVFLLQLVLYVFK